MATKSPKLWTEVTKSEHAHERAALHFIRERFPTREPFRAWANFTFVADDGTRNEVDLLVVSPTGVYLVEIKSHPGRIDGDAATWVWTSPEGRPRSFDNPIILAEKKAKKLKSLLMKQRSLRDRRGPGEGFYLRSVVFLSKKDLIVNLNELGRTDVYGPDPESETAEQKNRLPGIIKLFNKVDPRRGRQVDRPLSLAIAQAMDKAGIRESTTHRQVGHFELGELLDEGPGWQDFATVHPQMKETHRRIRIYQTGQTLDEKERETLVRAAQREFKFLERIEHAGIERPLELLQSPRGPALVFPRDPSSQRLDHWLNDHAPDLDIFDRIELVRQVGEALRHAHRQGLYHRALTPHHISVSESNGRTELKIRDWSTALQKISSNTSEASGTTHVVDRVQEQAQVFLAPETLSLPNPQPAPADIWSLGAIAFLILSGKPPAPDLDGLHEQLRDTGYLTLATGMDAPPQELDDIIRSATVIDASERLVSVDEFLERLDWSLEDMTAPAAKDPLEARHGDVIGDTWTVERRVGSGRTSVVLLARNGPRSEILKIARSHDHAQHLRDEHEILSRLRDRRVIAPYGLEEIEGRTVLRLEPALTTLADEIRDHGALSLDLLERFGTDLLGAVAYLDAEGVAHRDIKPDNIGIAERGKDKERHLVLFDFSLSRIDPSEIRVGTAGYLDPFLEERKPRVWDDQAERYAVAVTLYEMATGTRPQWGDGSTDPALTNHSHPSIESDLIDQSVRDALTAFFSKGLSRNPKERFDTISDMQREWEQAFTGTDHASTPETGTSAADVDLTDVTVETPLAELGLSAKVRNAADRLNVITAGGLAGISQAVLVSLPGLGAATRRDVSHLAQRIRDEVSEVRPLDSADSASIDRIAEQLVPKPPADEDHRTIISTLLELTEAGLGRWPTVRDVADVTELGRKTVHEALGSAQNRWKKQPELTGVRKELVDLLARRGGIAGADELAGTLVMTRGSLVSGEMRIRRARAVLRSAVEAESTLQQPRLVFRRLGCAHLLALDGRVGNGEGTREWNADLLTDAAAALGEVAEDLAQRQPLPSAEQVLRELRQVTLPEGAGPFTDARLVRLAAAAAGNVSVSTRLELYPTSMDAEQALRESRSVLLDRRGLDPTEVHARVRARFPDVREIPARPELDELLEALGLRWQGQENRYVLPRRGGVLSTAISSSPATTSFATADEREAAVRDLDARLNSLVESGGFLALTVDKRRFAGAADAIAQSVKGSRVDLDRTLIEAMKRKAVELGAQWTAFVNADKQPGQPNWRRIGQLVDRVLPDVESEIYRRQGVVVLSGVGLLVRYERTTLFEKLRDDLTRGHGDHVLRGVVLVVPGDDPTARPAVDGLPIPVITANQWAHLPSAWLTQHAEEQAA